MTALKQISSLNNLSISWSKIYKGSGPYSRMVSGVDKESIADFNSNSETKLRELSYSLRSKSRYRYALLRPVLIKKKSGKDRLICVPTVRDRIVQRSILEHLSKDNRYGLDNGVSFGFIPEKGVKKAVIEAKRLRTLKPYVYKTDISSFFDSIDRSILRNVIEKKIRSRSIHNLLFDAIECEIQPTSRNVTKRIRALGIKEGRGVRQGMPLSPLFSNLILYDFDKIIIRKHMDMVRYADDLVIFAKSYEECQSIHEIVSIELSKINLQVPDLNVDSKSIIYRPDEPAEFLGIGIVKDGDSYMFKISQEQIESIKSKILQLSDLNELYQKRVTLTKYSKILDNTLGGYEGAYRICDNYKTLEDSMRNWRKKAVGDLFRKGFKIDLDSLTTMQRSFLEL